MTAHFCSFLIIKRWKCWSAEIWLCADVCRFGVVASCRVVVWPTLTHAVRAVPWPRLRRVGSALSVNEIRRQTPSVRRVFMISAITNGNLLYLMGGRPMPKQLIKLALLLCQLARSGQVPASGYYSSPAQLRITSACTYATHRLMTTLKPFVLLSSDFWLFPLIWFFDF